LDIDNNHKFWSFEFEFIIAIMGISRQKIVKIDHRHHGHITAKDRQNQSSPSRAHQLTHQQISNPLSSNQEQKGVQFSIHHHSSEISG
jgi:hypothetical protein